MEKLNELALFAGIGGGIIGTSHYCRTVCAVEHDAYAACVLISRQNDGPLPLFPVWGDVRTFDGGVWRGLIDVVSGGFPCQDISSAGRGAGLAGKRSGLWFEMLRIIGEVEPKFVFIENSPHLRTKGLGTILEGLASLGFDAEWDCISAAEVGAPHKRDRMWILAAHSDRARIWLQSWRGGGQNREIPAESSCAASDIAGDGCDTGRQPDRERSKSRGSSSWWATEPDVGRVVHGLPYRVDRIRCLGNAQVPAVARLAFERLMGRFIK